MASENAKIDQNYRKTLLGVTDDAAAEIRRLLVDPVTGRLKVSAVISGSLGSVTATNLGITGTAGNGYITLIAQNPTQPTPPPDGTTLLHAFTTGNFTRIEQDNEAVTNVTIGRDTVFICSNQTGVTLVKGSVVHAALGFGNIPSIVLAKAADLSIAPVIGIVLDDILDGAYGQVMHTGIIDNIDGLSLAEGAPIFLDPSTLGAITGTRPVSPSYVQRIGTVLNGDPVTGSFLITIGPFIGGLESGTTATTWTGQTIKSNALAGAGTRMVVTDADGVLGNQAIPTGTVTAIGVTTANGVSGTSSGGATPNLTITLGAITPTTIVASSTISGTRLTSTIATGTSPLAITSTTLNTNLNADLFDGQHGSFYTRPTTTKTSLVDADETTGNNSAASFGQIKTTWTNVKAFLKTYFDTLYQPVTGVWTSYTPTVTSSIGTITTVTCQGYWTQIGKTIHANGKITITINGTGAGGLFVPLPTTAKRLSSGVGVGREVAVTGKGVTGVMDTTGSHYYTYTSDNSYPGGAGLNVIDFSITYEAA